MNVNVTERGKLELDLSEIIQIAAHHDADAVIETIATTDDIVERVVDQLVDGTTKDGSYGYDGCLRVQRERLIGSISEFSAMRDRDLETVRKCAHNDGYISGIYDALRFVFGEQIWEWPAAAEDARKALLGKIING